MYLERLQIHGFKSFAKLTTLDFLAPQNDKKGITAIVGPNGSGKSNIADAIRWVLGEQSLKILRGKKSEDVIFAGSDKKARLGAAEVSLFLNNHDNEAPIDFSDVVITRRLYRDGESEYLINGHTARLQDIVLLLARARFGQKNYLVIGQGMADYILRATPAERKELLDEAAGVKEMQIKRQISFNKLEATEENLKQAESLLQEIAPRLRYLERQVKRLSEREAVEGELRETQKKYYGQLWHNLALRVTEFERQYARRDEELQKKKIEQENALNRFRQLEKTASVSQAFLELQKKYEELLAERNKAQDRKFKLENEMALARVRAERESFAPLPIDEVAGELEILLEEYNFLLGELRKISKVEEAGELAKKMEGSRFRLENILRRVRNGGKKSGQFTPDPLLAQEAEELAEMLKGVEEKLREINRLTHGLNQEEKQKKGEIFELQRVLQEKQEEVHAAEQELNGIKIELAKLETKRDGLEEEITLEMGPLGSVVKLKPLAGPSSPPEELQTEIFKLKHRLELIGGIDPEIAAEHKGTKERHDFLFSQTNDLRGAVEDIVRTVMELDKVMKERRDSALLKINEEFSKFFQILFAGGSARLITVYEEEETGGEEEEKKEEKSCLLKEKFRIEEPLVAGIDISAKPPGKRVKDINILSGGERALTSAALICAILSFSPSPFVVLDEVDAALDEANSLKLAEIFDRLSRRTQFIVITHNRAIMTKAQALYGVTMGEEGVSRLLSVKLEEAKKMVKE
ncbi:MAG: chromosome segregation protein SMC [Candidatus Magasanikbacteria bacterium]|nr:chromosome segregation protein SMC [Candidatus Magasanikbacteria bacterium]